MKTATYNKLTPLEQALASKPYGQIDGILNDIKEICCIGTPTLNNWRTGRSTPTIAKRVKINRYFGYTVYPLEF